MPRTPVNQAYDTVAALDKALSQVEALRRSFPGVLPVAAAEAHMDDTEDCIDRLRRGLTGALAVMNDEIDRLEAAAANDDQAEAA